MLCLVIDERACGERLVSGGCLACWLCRRARVGAALWGSSSLPAVETPLDSAANNDVSLAGADTRTGPSERSLDRLSLSLLLMTATKARQLPVEVDGVHLLVCLDISVVDSAFVLRHQSLIPLLFLPCCHLLPQSPNIRLSPAVLVLLLLIVDPVSLLHLLLDDCSKRVILHPLEPRSLLFLRHLLP